MGGLRQADPIAVSEVVIPMAVLKQIACMGLTTTPSLKDTAVGDLLLFAFFYILYVGKYTHTQRVNLTHAPSNLRMYNMAFKCGETFVRRDAYEQELATATAVTPWLSNQVNMIRGSPIHRSSY